MTPTVDFFISYTGKDKAWAEWIAITLRNAGFTTRVQSRDFGPGSHFVVEMQKAAVESVRVMPVLSPEYFKSKFTLAEWTSAFAFDPTGEKRKLVPVRIRECQPPGLLAQVVYIDLAGLNKEAAKEKLLDDVRSLPVVDAPFPGDDSSEEPLSTTDNPTHPTKPRFLHNLPFSPNPFFTGREQLLKDLHDALHQKKGAAITQPQTVHGLGGVGKTQLAVEYAWANQADYDAILWAGAASPGELQANIAALATVLRLPEAAAPQQEVRVAAVLGWLQGHTRWLLILDNADTPEAQQGVGALLPPGLPGHVIVTSRLGNWPICFADLEVRVLAPKAAEEFLIERTEKAHFHAGPPAEARAVAEELGFLPLALEQAAAYLVHLKVTFAEYRRRLAESRPRLLEFASQGGTGYQKTVATTWLVTEAQLSPRARAALQLAALLAPDEIPRAMFTQGGKVIEEAMELLPKEASAGTAASASVALAAACGSSLSPREERAGREPERGVAEEALGGRRPLTPALSPDGGEGGKPAKQGAVGQPACGPTVGETRRISRPSVTLSPNGGEGRGEGASADVEEALAELAGYSLIELGAEGFTLHRLLQAVLHDRLEPDTLCAWVDRAVQLVSDFAMGDPQDVRTWPVWNRVHSHATAILKEAWNQDNPTAGNLMNQLGLLLQTKALYAEAEPFFRRALEIDEKILDHDHANTGACLNNLALLLLATNRLAEAEPLMRRALVMMEKIRGVDHLNVAATLQNLASLLQERNHLVEAEPLYRRALAIWEKNLGMEHPNVTFALNGLGFLLRRSNRMTEAESLYRRALATDERNYGQEHPNVAMDLNNLASLLQDTDRVVEAEPLYRRALAIWEKSQWQVHPNVASALNNLAELLKDRNQLAEAEPLMRRALLLDEQSLGPDHPHVVRDLNNLAHLLQHTNRLEEAEPLYRRVLAIREASFGEEHRDVAQSLEDLAVVLLDTNRLAEAEPLLRRAMKIDEKILGPEHPNVAGDLNGLACVFLATNRLAEAEPLMRRGVEIFEKNLVPGHPLTKQSKDSLASIQAELRQQRKT